MRYLILDTKEITEYLISHTKNLLEFDPDPNKFMPTIINAISKEATAELDIAYECLDIMNSALGEVYELDMERIVDAMIKMGTVMYFELKRLNAYEEGVLNLKYYGMLGKDVVLTSHYRT